MHISVRYVFSKLRCSHLGAAGLGVGRREVGLEVEVGVELVEGMAAVVGGVRGWSGWLDRRLVQVLEADALDVASIGRAVTAGAEVRRGGVSGGAEASGGRHQAADRRARSLRLDPESWFYHCRACPAKR